jgi:aldehyde dehydrogenase (NAD+)
MSAIIHSALEAQRQFFASGATRDVAGRKARLRRLAEIIRAWDERILGVLKEDLGKPRIEAYLSEVHLVLDEIGYTLKRLDRWVRPRRVRSNVFNWPARCEIRSEPYGVVLILGPWNYPFQLVMAPLISAVAAGNCVVTKPSEQAPATAALMRELLSECFDPHQVTTFMGGVEVAQGLLEERFDYVFYTGNGAVARKVMSACARHLTPVTLELGGKCPCIVDHRIHLGRAVRRIARGKFMNAGQTCVAPDYVCVHESIYEEFVSRMQSTVGQFYGSEPGQSPDYGRIVNERHFDRLYELLPERQRREGGHDRARRFIAPTVVRDVGWNDRLMEEEIFGPILPILAYSDLGSVLVEISQRPKPLACYVFSESVAVQERVLESIASGGVCINDTVMHITALNLPFGGVGESGMGRYRGRFGFDTFSHSRSVMRKGFRFDLFNVCPPYGSTLERIKPFLRRRFWP